LILSRRRLSASLWTFRDLASVSLRPEDDDSSGAAVGVGWRLEAVDAIILSSEIWSSTSARSNKSLFPLHCNEIR
jgi:hypothetical protein